MNISKVVKHINETYPDVKARYCAEYREIQIRFAAQPDYTGPEVGFFDIGHTAESKAQAIEDACAYAPTLSMHGR